MILMMCLAASLTLAAISLVAACLVVLSARPPASKVLQGPGLSDQGMRRTKNLAKSYEIFGQKPDTLAAK